MCAFIPNLSLLLLLHLSLSLFLTFAAFIRSSEKLFGSNRIGERNKIVSFLDMLTWCNCMSNHVTERTSYVLRMHSFFLEEIIGKENWFRLTVPVSMMIKSPSHLQFTFQVFGWDLDWTEQFVGHSDCPQENAVCGIHAKRENANSGMVKDKNVGV